MNEEKAEEEKVEAGKEKNNYLEVVDIVYFYDYIETNEIEENSLN